MNYNLNINLLKLANTCVIDVQSKATGIVKKGVFIPIEDNDLYVSLDNELNLKGLLLSLVAWGLKEKGKYGDTHIIKQDFSKETRETLTEEQLKDKPILGNMKEIEKPNTLDSVSSASFVSSEVPF